MIKDATTYWAGPKQQVAYASASELHPLVRLLGFTIEAHFTLNGKKYLGILDGNGNRWCIPRARVVGYDSGTRRG